MRRIAGLAPSDRAGVDGAIEALFFEPSAMDWLDQGASIALKIGALAAAFALWPSRRGSSSCSNGASATRRRSSDATREPLIALRSE